MSFLSFLQVAAGRQAQQSSNRKSDEGPESFHYVSTELSHLLGLCFRIVLPTRGGGFCCRHLISTRGGCFAAGIDITVTHCWFARCAPRNSAWNMQFPSPGTGSRRKPLAGTYSLPMHVRSRRAQDAREAARTDLRGAVSRSPAPTQRSPDEKACRATSHEGCHSPDLFV